MAISTFLAPRDGHLRTGKVKQQHALPAGSIGLFPLLAIVICLTRKIAWYGLRN